VETVVGAAPKEHALKIRGPILTLVAVLGLAMVLVTVNTASSPADPVVAAAAAAVPAPPAPGPAGPPPDPAPVSAAVDPPPAFPPKAKFVGEAATKKGPIPIAITVDGGRAKAYVCDGKKVEAWLQGTAKDGAVELTGRRGARLSGTLQDDSVAGTLLLPDYPEWTFAAKATASTRAGLYRAAGAGATTGWIVRDDAGRDQVGISRDAAGVTRSAPLLDLAGPGPAAAVPGTPSLVDGDTDVLPGP
jgi:hypothetical protein